MYEVDARGLSCPEPLMMTAEALKKQKGQIKVLVSEHAPENECREICQRSWEKGKYKRSRLGI